ncbi:unnamed protein product [Effrenium voratum]|nr:unnamed protein product [Effrenium voratum]
MTEYRVQARYRPEAESGEIMLLMVKPRTGRTHQIRVHMASVGRPLVGDLTYGRKHDTLVPFCPRLFLHCRQVQLLDAEDSVFQATANLPDDLSLVLERLAPSYIEKQEP